MVDFCSHCSRDIPALTVKCMGIKRGLHRAFSAISFLIHSSLFGRHLRWKRRQGIEGWCYIPLKVDFPAMSSPARRRHGRSFICLVIRLSQWAFAISGRYGTAHLPEKLYLSSGFVVKEPRNCLVYISGVADRKLASRQRKEATRSL